MQSAPPTHSTGSTGEDADNGGGYRALVDKLLGYEGAAMFQDVLVPWLDAHPDEAARLASFTGRAGAAIPAATLEERWRLYGLSRVCELVREAAFPVGGDDQGQRSVRLAGEQFHAFFRRLGIDAIEPDVYTPFHCEIVRVVTAKNPRQPASLTACHWPCLMLGNLLIQRAGVTVLAGEEVLRPGIADAATLYWAYSRETRPTHDPAHGWGSNSAWRTGFRRDYVSEDAFHFNVDGEVDLAALDAHGCDAQGLTRDQRIELLVNRSFVTTARAHADLFPYRDRLRLPVRGAVRVSGLARLWKKLF